MSKFWRDEEPVLDENGLIQVGGMWDTQQQAWNSEHYIKAFVGGYGCVAADTKVVSYRPSSIEIQDIVEPRFVMSWDEDNNKFVWAYTTGSFLKGVAEMFRVTIEHGAFDAIGDHLVLTPCGYTKVRDLVTNEKISRYAATSDDTPPNKSTTAVLSIVSLGERPYWDMQVADTNNYVTEDGCIHHNSGKSLLLGKRVIASALHNSPVPVMLVSPSYRQAKRTIIPTLLSLLHGRAIKYKYNRSDAMLEITYHKRVGHIWIGSGDVPDSLKGSNLAAVYCDEAFMLDYSVIEICLSRIRDPRARLREMFLAGTPEQGLASWGYEVLFGDKKENFDIGVYQASTLENKALPQTFIDSLMAAYDDKTRDAYIHGKFVNFSEGAIYGSFDRDRHVKPVPFPAAGVKVMVGVDFNFDPACATLFYVTEDGCMHVFAEVHLTGGHDTYELVDNIFEVSRGQADTFYPDPSGCQRKTSARVGTTDITIIQQAGLRLRDVPNPFQVRSRRRTPPRRDRYNATNAMFREDMIEIDPSCKHLIKGFMLSTYEGFSKHDGLDHQPDSCTYYCELTNPVTNKVKRMRQWY